MNITWIGDKVPQNYQVGRKSVYTGKQYIVQGIVLHWMDGTLSGTDAWFNNPKDVDSATYGIGDDQIHQYLKEEDTAYQAGRYEPDVNNPLANLNTIGIEHQGSPLITISDQTYETSAQLVADICTRHTIPCDRDHIKAHHEVSKVATSCPGTLDVDRIVKRAQEILSGQSAPTNATINSMPTDGFYPQNINLIVTASIGVHVRTSPQMLSNNVHTSIPVNSHVSAVGFVSGDTPPGTNNNLWWKLAQSDNGNPLYIWSGATNVTPTIPTVTAPSIPVPSIPVPSVATPIAVQPIDTTNQVTDLEKQLSDSQNKIDQLNQQLQDVTAKYNPFSAMGYSSVDDVTKALNEKDQTITDVKTELTQVTQRNIDLLDQLKKKEEEDYTAIQDGIDAVKELGTLKDNFNQIVQKLGVSKPGIDAIINQIEFYQSSAQKARNDAINAQNKLSKVLSSDNLKQVEKTGIDWLLGVLHLG